MYRGGAGHPARARGAQTEAAPSAATTRRAFSSNSFPPERNRMADSPFPGYLLYGAAQAGIDTGRDQRKKEPVELFPVHVDIVALVVALFTAHHVHGPHGKKLRSHEHFPWQAQPEPGEHVLGIRRQQPPAAFFPHARSKRLQQVPMLQQEHPVGFPDKPGQGGAGRAPSHDCHVKHGASPCAEGRSRPAARSASSGSLFSAHVSLYDSLLEFFEW